jgi:D-glycero-D-manno-heptose 1,7-bisphosphate phosphatase
MDRNQVLIVLDRDGVLNPLIRTGNLDEPFDSPLRPSEASVFPWVPGVLRSLTEAGYGLVVATNQPAWAKGKAARADLEEVNRIVVAEAEREGGVILSSHVCFHRAEDGCACRKPKTGLLEEAFRRHSAYLVKESWMVGDRAVDVLAGAAFKMKTALLTAVKPPESVHPSFRGTDLRDFARFLL